MNAATITQNVQNIAIASQGVKDVLERKTEIQIWAEDKIAEAVANEIQDNGYDSDTFIFDLELSVSLSAEVRGSYIINGYTEDDRTLKITLKYVGNKYYEKKDNLYFGFMYNTAWHYCIFSDKG